jgi:hypothetical protein
MANLSLCTAGILGKSMAFTGHDKFMQKIYLMHLFCSPVEGFEEEEGLGCCLLILAATTMANYGVITPNYHQVYQLGLPTNSITWCRAWERESLYFAIRYDGIMQCHETTIITS